MHEFTDSEPDLPGSSYLARYASNSTAGRATL